MSMSKKGLVGNVTELNGRVMAGILTKYWEPSVEERKPDPVKTALQQMVAD